MLIRRSPLAPRSRPLRRLTPLRRGLDRILTMDPAVVHARERVEERDGSCILCDGPGVDVHHRLPRGRGGARRDRDVFALSRLLWLCRDDHLWVESHRLLAYGLGLLVRHGVTPCCERFRCSTMAAGCCWTTTATSSRSRRTASALRSRHESPTRAAIVGSD